MILRDQTFSKLGGTMCTYNQLKNGEKTLQQVEEDKKKNIKKIKNYITIKWNNIRKSEA